MAWLDYYGLGKSREKQVDLFIALCYSSSIGS